MESNINSPQELNQADLKDNIKISRDTHSFDPLLASQIGVHAAIIVKHFIHWVRLNKKANRNFHDGRTWSYQTLEEMSHHFEYLSKRQIEKILNKLVNEYKILIKGNYNKTKFDRTCWYAFNNEGLFIGETEGEIHITKRGNGNPQKVTPIPDTKTNIKRSSKEDPKKQSASDDAVFLFKYFEDAYKKMRESKGLKYKKIQCTKTQMNALTSLLKSYSIDYIKKIINASFSNDFWSQHVDKPSYLKIKFEKLEHLLKNPKRQSNENWMDGWKELKKKEKS